MSNVLNSYKVILIHSNTNQLIFCQTCQTGLRLTILMVIQSVQIKRYFNLTYQITMYFELSHIKNSNKRYFELN